MGAKIVSASVLTACICVVALGLLGELGALGAIGATALWMLR
jgi:hypothetical protein